MAEITIAIDAMGGDHGTRSVVPAAREVLAEEPDLRLILVGDSYILNKQLKFHKLKESDRLWIHHATQKVGMDESPVNALRHKKDSSMRVALNLVKQGSAQACVSAGNTGALLATAHFVLKTLPGIDRPAIIRVLPTTDHNKNVRVLDLGANVDSTPENLLQFAIMGSTLASAVEHIDKPRIGLLNIGVEEIKGNDLVKKTAKLLKQCKSINYIGYVEGDQVYRGAADVIVCDGFVGNVALKVTEGSVKMVMMMLKEAFYSSIGNRIIGFLAKHVLLKLVKKFDPERYNGASLIGLQGIVVKSHGGARPHAFANAIRAAMQEVTMDVPTRISQQVTMALKELNHNEVQ